MTKILIHFLFLTAFTLQESFEKVVENAKNETLKKRLEEFRKGGIEKEVFTYNVEELIEEAESYLGVSHKMGGIDNKGLDCSGLVYVVHKKFGVKLPRSSQEQARYGKVVYGYENLKRGDLVFYYNSYKTSNFITHVGIYLGDDMFIHTSSSKGVIISVVNDKYYWGERFLFATRLKK